MRNLLSIGMLNTNPVVRMVADADIERQRAALLDRGET
jgi:hypothetical protein